MIVFFDKDLLHSCVESFNNDTGNHVCVIEKEFGKLFPCVRAGKLIYNPHFETYLLLHNLAVTPHANINDLPSLFYDVYTLIDYNYYSRAYEMLRQFEDYVSICIERDLKSLVGNMDINLCSQIIATIYHELGHILYHQNNEAFKTLIDFTQKYLEDETLYGKKWLRYSPIGFIIRGRKKMSKIMLSDEKTIEELACDLWGIWVSFCYLKEKYTNEQYIHRIINQSSFAVNVKILFDFSSANSRRWIKDWKKNVMFYSGTLNRYNVATAYCIELSDDLEDEQTLHFLRESLKNTIFYNWKNANNISRTLICQGASPHLDLCKKKMLMERLSEVEKKLVDCLKR